VGPVDYLLHLLGFVAPAAAVAVVVSGLARLLLPKTSQAQSWWACTAIDFLAGTAALLAGLWYFGRDGKMLTYAALVLACATAQWLASRAWR
jgi:hypothetical protein